MNSTIKNEIIRAIKDVSAIIVNSEGEEIVSYVTPNEIADSIIKVMGWEGEVPQ
jgi:hypothetical protein